MRINGKAFAHLMATTKAPGPVSLIIGHTFAAGIHVGIFLWPTSGWPAAAVAFITCAALHAVSLIAVPVEIAARRRR